MPSLNTVVVTTGGGFEYDAIVPFLEAALIDPEQPLPSNPEGVAQLDAVLTALVQAPSPYPAGPLPDAATTISGKTYLFGANAADVETLSLEFDDTAEATMRMKRQGKDEIWPIGLDGKYRLLYDGRGLRGYWADPQTFVVEIFDIGQSTLQLHFEDDRVEVISPGAGSSFEGQIENP
jgi:hypothetical protein